jgi:hypothetical protein
MKVKCNKCDYIGEESEFPCGNDFFQNRYIAACPRCDNRQSPGDASMRGFGGVRPFQYVREEPDTSDIVGVVLHRAGEAS